MAWVVLQVALSAGVAAAALATGGFLWLAIRQGRTSGGDDRKRTERAGTGKSQGRG